MSARSRSLLELSAVALLVLFTRNANGQAAGASLDTATNSASRARMGLVLSARDILSERKSVPAVVVAVSSSALTVVTVTVPGDFNDGDSINYAVRPLRDGTIVGRLNGTITAGSARRTILFAMRAPRRLVAGQVSLATVQFSSATLDVEVPIVGDVAAYQGITISFPTRLIAAPAGGPIRIPYRLTNEGNAPDTVTVSVVVPVGWTVLDAGAATPLRVRESIDAAVRVLPPPRAEGLTRLRLVVFSGGQPVAESSVDVQLASGSSIAPTGSGPTLRAGVAAAVGPWPGTSTIQSLEVHGPVSDGLTIRARASSAPQQDVANHALSRSGISTLPPALQLAAQDWRIDAGALGTSMTDLTGVNLVGRGASLAIAKPHWVASAVAVTPDVGLVNSSGSLTASRLEFTPGAFAVSSAFSRLRESRGSASRALDAWSLGGALPGVLGGRLGAEVAHRRFDESAAAGWSASWLRRTPDESFDARYVHAPGGSGAFARAADEFSANASRRLTRRVHVTGGAWRSADEGAASLSTLDMSGWTLGANVALRDGLQVSLTGHESAFDASTGLGSFGSGERALGAGLDLQRGAFAAQVTATMANLTRTTTLQDTTLVVLQQSAPRGGVRGLVSSGRSGATSIAITGQYERTGPGVGAAPQQWSYGIRVDTRPPIGYRRPFRVELSADRVGGSFDAAKSLMLRAGVDVELPLATSLVMSAERNPYVLPAAGSGAWMYVVGLSRSVTLPRLAGGGTRGVVYRDINGNGRRESSEPGFAGVMLRRGADVAVTDQRGAFMLMGDRKTPYELEARSLPVGWISSSTAVPAGTRQIGAVSVAPIEVELSFDPADTSRISTEHLADVVVTLRDSAGYQWASRRVSNTRLVFDAVPPGTYTVDVDASGSREPLRPSGDLKTVVTTGRSSSLVRIVMRARQLRFSNPRRGS
jgi:hypothetical protein